MKILWIVNCVLNDFSVHLYSKQGNGVWMDALLESFKAHTEHELLVATTLPVKKTVRYEKDGIVYYALPNNYPALYNENKKANINSWRALLESEKPNLIQVWGTEFTHGLCALRLAKNIPSVIYMQGFLGSIAKYYQSGIETKELRKSITIRDFLKRDSILQQQKKYQKKSLKEKEMLQLSGNIISENDWCNSNVLAIAPQVKPYYCALSINKVFSQKEWNISEVERHSIMCTASGYTIKGLHMVFNAVALLKRKYANLKVYVPGTKMISDRRFKAKIRKNGYTNYIEKLISRLGIQENIVWLGKLSQEDLLKQYQRSHVFVMSSAIENHSSSLKEAMMVGVPCVCSAVGGIPEYVVHGNNAFLYRFEEFAQMAKHIENLFENDQMAQEVSISARKSMLELHQPIDLYQRIMSIYKTVIGER